MTIMYSCKSCGIYREEITVKDRGSENVVEWMEKEVVLTISNDHYLRSPSCSSTKMDEVLIPYPDGSSEVGKPVKH